MFRSFLIVLAILSCMHIGSLRAALLSPPPAAYAPVAPMREPSISLAKIEKIDAVLLPVQFETASAQFTTLGKQAAKELLDAVRRLNPAELTLVGHTDERGTAGYNMRLSKRRVRAVVDYLRQNGVVAKINMIAKGKSEPVKLGELAELITQEEIWALNRRVEWQRN